MAQNWHDEYLILSIFEYIGKTPYEYNSVIKVDMNQHFNPRRTQVSPWIQVHRYMLYDIKSGHNHFEYRYTRLVGSS